MGSKVAVIGLGTMGSMALWQLAKQGITVVGFEQFGIGHDRSAVGGESRLFRTAYREGAQYVPLLREAKELWRELEKESGNELLTLNGGLTIGKENTDNVNNVLKSIYDFNIDYEVYSVQDAKKLFPQHRLEADDVVIKDKEAGFLRPELAVVTAINQAVKLGATVHRNTKIEDITHTEDGVIVSVNEQKHRFDHVIVTAGPWANELIPQYKSFIQARKIIMSWFVPKDLTKFQVDNYPTFARTIDSYDFFGLPTLDSSMVKIALVGDMGTVENPTNLNRNITLDEISDHVHIAETYFNNLNPDPVRLSVHMDAYTPDDHAIVGIVPTQPNLTIMTGFSGHGFKFAPIMGKIATELALNGKTVKPVEHLNPGRFNE